MVGALDVPTSGKVLIDGKDIFSMNDRKLTVFRRRNIGFIFQAFNLVPELTVELQGVDAHYLFRENPRWAAFCERQQCAHRFAKPGDDLGDFLKFSIYGAFKEIERSA